MIQYDTVMEPPGQRIENVLQLVSMRNHIFQMIKLASIAFQALKQYFAIPGKLVI